LGIRTIISYLIYKRRR